MERSGGRNGNRPINVVVVDDHELVREGLAALIERETDIHLVNAYQSAEDAIRGLRARRRPVDVAIIDHQLPGMNGAAACEKILEARLAETVVILTSFPDDEVLRSCLHAGASGYLTKDAATTDLAESIRLVAKGRIVLCPEAIRRVVEWVRTGDRPRPTMPISQKDVEILRLVARGLSNTQIGRELHMSPSAVKKRLGALMRTFGVSRRWEAVAIGTERGLI